jgi:hypothetical protein
MALSMDEQRMLAEIEKRLTADDPGLASCLSTFRRPGPATVLRSPRARILGSLFTVLLVAMVSLMVYAMIPFRGHAPRQSPPSSMGVPGNTAMSATRTDSQPPGTQSASVAASTSARSSTATSAPTRSAARTSSAATGKAQRAKGKPTNASASPAAKP